jgi:hypothetical protein
MDGADGDITTLDADLASIFAAAPPTLPSLIALIVTEPGAIPATIPLAFTVAIAELELCHAIVRSLTSVPSVVCSSADACTV